MRYNEYIWNSFDGLRYFAQSWEPDNKPIGVINLIHGLGDHSGRYVHWAKLFVENNYALLTFDYRGHGKSEGRRGHSPSYQHLLKDVDLLIEKSNILFPSIPIYLYGHSMGGNLVINYVLNQSKGIKGLIITSPWFRLSFEPSRGLLVLKKIIGKFLPSFLQVNKSKPEHITHNKEKFQSYSEDPLTHFYISARMFINVYNKGRYALNNASKLDIPLLLMHGSMDKITSPKASFDFAEKAKNTTTLKIWDRLFHELHNEYEYKEVFEYIINWLGR